MSNLNSHPKSWKANTPPMETRLPSRPPQTKPDISRAPREFEDEFNVSRMASALYLSPPASPRSESNLTRREKKPAENKTQVDVLSLKTKLGLGNWRCGCPTLKGTPCTRQIPEGNKDQINSQLESMRSLTRSSPELEAKLDTLAMLVHCYQHDCGIPKDSRIDTWAEAFPAGDGIVSVEKQIRKALGRVSTQCIRDKWDGERCKLRIGGRKVQNCTKTIDEIVKPEVYLDDASLDGFLKVLETNMCCHRHANPKSFQKVAPWKLSIFEIRKEAGSKLVQSSDLRDEFKKQGQAPDSRETGRISTENNNNLVLQNYGLPIPRSSRSLSPELLRDPRSFWPETYDTTPFKVIARSNKLDDCRSSYGLILSEIKRPLDKLDQKDGYVYLYEVEGNSGFVKIGYTGRTLETRHQEWDFDCNRVPKALYPIPSSSARVVPNARRVEALCHAELDHRRARIYCDGCLKQHIEWFEVSAEEAIAVIRKWSRWINTHPYQPPRARSGVNWTLRDEERRKVSDIDRFMKEISPDTKVSGPKLDTAEAALRKA